MIANLFHELILVSLNRLDDLSTIPTSEGWYNIYDLSKRHTLVGITFWAVQKLYKGERVSIINLPSELRMKWLGSSALIQSQNDLLNRRCLELQNILSSNGCKYCFLKGQGLVELYPKYLLNLRQCGDIDVWIKGGYKKIMSYISTIAYADKVTDIHVNLLIFKDVEVEVHFKPAYLSNRIANNYLQNWFLSEAEIQFANISLNGLHVPTNGFNRIYILLHIYRHLFGEGIGLRQIMDMYFVLRSSKFTKVDKELFEKFKVLTFVQGLNWVMHYMFEPNEKDLSKYEAVGINKKVGQFLLDEIMQMGNFGHYDNRFNKFKYESHFSRFMIMVKAKLRFISYFPQEVFWQPIDIIRRFFIYRYLRRIRNNNYKKRKD